MIQDGSRRVNLPVGPGEPRTRPLKLVEAELRDVIIEHLYPRKVDPIIVLLIRKADEVKVASHNDREEGSGDLMLRLSEEDRGATVVRRTIDDHDLPFEVERLFKDLHTNKKFASIHPAHLKGGILHT